MTRHDGQGPSPESNGPHDGRGSGEGYHSGDGTGIGPMQGGGLGPCPPFDDGSEQVDGES